MKNMPLQFAKLVLVILISPAAMAVSVKSDPLATKGCMPRVSVADSEAAIHRFNLGTLNARPAEIQTLGAVLKWIETLNDGRPLKRAVRNVKYTYMFRNQCGKSSQEPDHQFLNRNGAKNYGENAAQLAHELGHLIGNTDSKGLPNPEDNVYIDYINFAGPAKCVISTYSVANSHEQFAELFAAFVTRPELLKKSTSHACKKAYEFFSTKLFAPTSDAAATRCMNRQSTAMLKLNLPPPEVALLTHSK